MKNFFDNACSCGAVHARSRGLCGIWYNVARLWAAKELVMVKQVKVSDRPVCLSGAIPLAFYNRAISVIEVISAIYAETLEGQLIITGACVATYEMIPFYNGKAIIPIPELEPGYI